MTRPLQVHLDEADLERLDAWARERGWMTPLLQLSGDIDGLPPDLSASFQRYLDETFVAESPTPNRIRRRSGKPVRR